MRGRPDQRHRAAVADIDLDDHGDVAPGPATANRVALTFELATHSHTHRAFHDALPRIITGLRAKGLQPVTLGSLLNG